MKRFARAILAAVLLGMLAIPARVSAAQAPPHYTVIDLGTLGGPQNYINNPGAVLNNRGMVALFGADINATDPHADNCFNPDCYRSHAAVWQNGHLVDLGAFPGATSSGLGGMSPNGLVAGVSTDGTIDPVANLPTFRAALFKNGHVIDLGTFGGAFSGATDVNNRGEVVGSAENTTQDPYAGSIGGAFNQAGLPGAGQNRAFLYKNGMKQDLGTLGGSDAEAWMINEPGQITGASFTTTTANATTGMPTQHPFLWDHGTMLDLGSLGGTNGLPANLNDAGQVVGSMDLAGDQTHHAFLWRNGKLTDLGTLGGPSSDAEWQNAAGDVVGRADTPNTGPTCSVGGPLASNHCPHNAVLWKNGTLIDLGRPVGATCATATGVNAMDQVVGSAGVCGSGGDGFLWQNGTMYVANDLVSPSPSGMRVEDTFYINDRGEIFGAGKLPNGDTRAILLEPDRQNTVAEGSVTRSGPGSSGSFTTSFQSSAPGQGVVLFGSGPGCSGLVESATQDTGAGTTNHTVTVTGNDLPGTVGDNGILPGVTYWYETVILTKVGREVDDNGGNCYRITVPATAPE
jgi:probable HAF family extracellular repeat protein